MSKTWHPACPLVQAEQYDDFERRALAVLVKLKIEPSHIQHYDASRSAECVAKLRGFLQFLLDHECYDDWLPIFHPHIPTGACSASDIAAMHYMYRQCFLKGHIVYLWQTEVRVVRQGQSVPLLGTGEWTYHPAWHLASFEAALSALHIKQGINHGFFKACSRCEQNWNRNSVQGCDMHPFPSCQKTAELFWSAKKYLKVYHENTVLQALKKDRESDARASYCNVEDNRKESVCQTRQKRVLPTTMLVNDDSAPHTGAVVTTVPPKLVTTPSDPHLTATSNAFVLYHMKNSTNGSAHSTIMLRSLISLMNIKRGEAADFAKQEEEKKLRLLIQNLRNDGVDAAILEKHVQGVYGLRNSVLNDADLSSQTSSIVFEPESTFADESVSSPANKRAKWSCSPMLEQGPYASPPNAGL